MVKSLLSKLMAEAVRRSLADNRMPPIPAGGDLLWRWFCDLSAARSFHAYGPNPISWSDIRAYMAVSRWPIEPHHIAILLAMDRAYLEFDLAERRAPVSSADNFRRSGRPLSTTLFDAMFG